MTLAINEAQALLTCLERRFRAPALGDIPLENIINGAQQNKVEQGQDRRGGYRFRKVLPPGGIADGQELVLLQTDCPEGIANFGHGLLFFVE